MSNMAGSLLRLSYGWFRFLGLYVCFLFVFTIFKMRVKVIEGLKIHVGNLFSIGESSVLDSFHLLTEGN